MISAANAVVWVNKDSRAVWVAEVGDATNPRPAWSDPIGAHYADWRDMDDPGRVQLMMETALDLAMQGFDLGTVLRAFSEVEEFRRLGSESYPMCRALTKAIVGKSLEPNTMTFEELLVSYAKK